MTSKKRNMEYTEKLYRSGKTPDEIAKILKVDLDDVLDWIDEIEEEEDRYSEMVG